MIAKFVFSMLVAMPVLVAASPEPLAQSEAAISRNTAFVARSEVEYCPAYTTLAQTVVDLKKPFGQYLLSVTDAADRRVINITADDVVFDRATFGSLIRGPGAADATLRSVKLNARKITIKEALSLIDGSLEIIADQIVFEGGARISILPGSSAKISLIARSLHLAADGTRHFDVRSRYYGNGSEETYADIPLLLDVAAESLYSGSTKLPVSSAPEELNRRFTRAILFDFRPKIRLRLDALGKEYWEDALRASPDWLRYSMAVWRAAFKVSPFDDCLREDLRKILESYLPIYQAVAPGDSTFELLSTLAALGTSVSKIDKVDIDGNGPAWVPNRPLGQLLNDLREYRVGGRRLETIDFSISMLRAAAKDAPIPEGELNSQTSTLSDQIRQSMLEFQNTSNELIEISAKLSANAGNLDSLRIAYKEREDRLKAHAEDLKKGAQDRAKIVSALATAASVVATAYTGTPATGAAVGGVIYAVGAAAQGRDTWTSLSQGIQFGAAIQGPLDGLKGAIDDGNKTRALYKEFVESFTLSNITIKEEIELPNPEDPGKPTIIKRDNAIKTLGEKASKIKAGIDNVLTVYQEFVPQPAPIPPVLEEDHDLKHYGEQMVIALAEAKDLTLKVEALQRTSQEQQLRLVQSSEKLARLKAQPATNEARRLEYGQLALEIARDAQADFAKLLDLVRRVTLVEFRQALPIDPKLLQSAYVSETISAGFDPAKTLDGAAALNQYISLLEDRRKNLVLLSEFGARAAQRQLEMYIERRGRTPLVNLPTVELTGGQNSPREEIRFIAELNRLLRDQYNARTDVNALASMYSRRIEIPFDIASKLDPRFPARLLQVAVTEVRHPGKLSGGDLVFSIDVERIGNLRLAKSFTVINRMQKKIAPIAVNQRQCARSVISDMECFSVDLRDKATPEANYFIPFEATVGQIKSGTSIRRTEAQSYWYIAPGDVQPSTGRTMLVTYPPAEARMYLRVRLDPDAQWLGPPTIDLLAISAEVFQ